MCQNWGTYIFCVVTDSHTDRTSSTYLIYCIYIMCIFFLGLQTSGQNEYTLCKGTQINNRFEWAVGVAYLRRMYKNLEINISFKKSEMSTFRQRGKYSLIDSASDSKQEYICLVSPATLHYVCCIHLHKISISFLKHFQWSKRI